MLYFILGQSFFQKLQKMYSKLSISAWNIGGLKHCLLGDKLRNSDLINDIKGHDLIFLTETWSYEINSIPGFKVISSLTATPKSKSSCRLSGGISLEFENIISLEKRTKNFLWCRIDNVILESTKDLFLCGVYIPPQMSRYLDEDIFDNLENDVVYFSKKGNVMLMGDFNARTSKNCNLRILNGRTLGDSFGKPTSDSKNGSSVVCDQDLTQNIENFIVKPPTYLSDHSQLVTWIKELPLMSLSSRLTICNNLQHISFHSSSYGKMTQ